MTTPLHNELYPLHKATNTRLQGYTNRVRSTQQCWNRTCVVPQCAELHQAKVPKCPKWRQITGETRGGGAATTRTLSSPSALHLHRHSRATVSNDTPCVVHLWAADCANTISRHCFPTRARRRQRVAIEHLRQWQSSSLSRLQIPTDRPRNKGGLEANDDRATSLGSSSKSRDKGEECVKPSPDSKTPQKNSRNSSVAIVCY
jgi:hypothetical protein